MTFALVKRKINNMIYIAVPSSFQAYVPEPDVDVQVRVIEVPAISYLAAELPSVIVGVATERTQILDVFKFYFALM